jgi:hypothetical protein
MAAVAAAEQAPNRPLARRTAPTPAQRSALRRPDAHAGVRRQARPPVVQPVP